SGIRSILDKVKNGKISVSETDSVEVTDFSDYEGYYSSQPWWGESYVSTWEDKLVILSLPTDNPGNSMTFFKYIEGDTFRRIRKDDELGEAMIFHRDENGKVVKVSSHGNYSMKMD
ncbi:MAG: hypothetical protein HKN68_13380, partial [Saprospiraceae bacterium]|nr:hypothetical protein [Saprospiraceae bacterium]